MVKLGIGYKFSDFVIMLGRGLACFLLALISAWKFTLVILAIIPLSIIAIVVMVSSIKKFTIKELKSYETAARISQEILVSIRTVVTFGLQKKLLQTTRIIYMKPRKCPLKKACSLDSIPVLRLGFLIVCSLWPCTTGFI